MLTYLCRVISESGEIKEVVLETKNTQTLNIIAQREQLHLLSYRKTVLKSHSNGIYLKSEELLLFTQTINMLLVANLTLKESLEIAVKAVKSRKIQALFLTISKQVDMGLSLSDSLNRSILDLPTIYRGLIKVGEKTGNLTMVLGKLSYYLEERKLFKDRIKSALIYPIFVTSLAMIFTLIFIFLILPQFNSMFSTLGGGLGDTLNIRGKILTNTLIITASIALILITTLKRGFPIVDRIIIGIPIIGSFILENTTSNIIFTLFVLTESSLSLEVALKYTIDVINNKLIKNELQKIRNSILQGSNLSDALTLSIFPKRVASFISVGEKSGSLLNILRELSKYYSLECKKKMDTFISIIDPTITLLIGGSLLALISIFILPVLTKMGDLL